MTNAKVLLLQSNTWKQYMWAKNDRRLAEKYYQNNKFTNYI